MALQKIFLHFRSLYRSPSSKAHNKNGKTSPTTSKNRERFADVDESHDKRVTSSPHEEDGGFRALLEEVDAVDIEHPPGIAGDLCNELRQFEYRSLGNIRVVGPLALLSALGAKSETVNGQKICFYAIASALTASGKEAIIRFIKAGLIAADLGENLRGEPRSDKQIVLDVSENLSVIYVLDEAQKFFEKSVSSRSSNASEKAISDLLMELKTTNLFKVPRGLISEAENQLNRRIKGLRAKGDIDSDNKAEELEAQIEALHHGIENPIVNLLAFSTPRKISFMTDLDTIESSLLGRIHPFLGPKKRERLRGFLGKNVKKEFNSELAARCRKIKESDSPITMSTEAESLLREVFEYFEADERLNHEYVGGIYARAMESIIGLSSILALESRVVDREMVLYATRRFLEGVRTTELELQRKGIMKREDELNSVRKICIRATGRKPMTLGVLANYVQKCDSRIRKKINDGDEQAVYKHLKVLINNGELTESDGKYRHRDARGS